MYTYHEIILEETHHIGYHCSFTLENLRRPISGTANQDTCVFISNPEKIEQHVQDDNSMMCSTYFPGAHLFYHSWVCYKTIATLSASILAFDQGHAWNSVCELEHYQCDR